MPLKKCSKDGKSGWKWGEQGKCYTGPNAKKQAIKQGIAVSGPEGFKKEVAGTPDYPLYILALEEYDKERRTS